MNDELYDATLKKDYSKIESLLNYGADPNWKFDGSHPVLIEAVKGQDVRAVRMLLSAGADPRQPAVDGTPPLAFAKFPEVRRLLESAMKRNSSY